jgi:hypothetical protein
MGNVIVFRRHADAVPTDSSSPHLANVCDFGRQQAAVIAIRTPLGLKQPSRETRGAKATPDGYLLVLLADQELSAGRDRQALSLLDAAYAAFDRQSGKLPSRLACS